MAWHPPGDRGSRAFPFRTIGLAALALLTVLAGVLVAAAFLRTGNDRPGAVPATPTNRPTVPATAPSGPTAAPATLATVHSGPPGFIASIDTMKGSRDTQTHPLSAAAIAAEVDLAARLNPTHITVDTDWDYPDYVQLWVSAVRATGRHVWFRGHPDQWENNSGATGLMTPADYEAALRQFILAHPALFQPGDIFDPCPEPEDGHYWSSTYGENWTRAYPNAATREFNQFIRDTSDVADAALSQIGVRGVITTIRSTNAWFALHPGALEQATVDRLGMVTIDSYPEGTTTDPATAASARVSELAAVEAAFHMPIVIGEMGYSDKVPVDDATQERVLRAELEALAPLPYVVGVNYWVGAGTATSGGFTHIFTGTAGNWSLRPAANVLAAYYAIKLGSLLPGPEATP